MALEPEAVVVRTLAVLSREVPGDESNKSISSSSSLEFIEMVVDCVLAGPVLLYFDFWGDRLNPLEPKSSRGLPAPGAIPVPGGRVCMRNDGSESMVRPAKDSWRSTCSITSVVASESGPGWGMSHHVTYASRFPSTAEICRDAGLNNIVV